MPNGACQPLITWRISHHWRVGGTGNRADSCADSVAQVIGEKPPLKINGDARFWSFHKDDDNYFEQPRKLFQLMTPAQREALFGNTGRAMGDAPAFIKFRHVRNCHAADPAYGAGVAKALGIDLDKALASKEADPMFGNPLVSLPA